MEDMLQLLKFRRFNIVFHFYQYHLYKGTTDMVTKYSVWSWDSLHNVDDIVFLPPPFQEKYKRALADTENLRSRSQKMIEDAKLYGNDQFSTFQQDPPPNSPCRK